MPRDATGRWPCRAARSAPAPRRRNCAKDRRDGAPAGHRRCAGLATGSVKAMVQPTNLWDGYFANRSVTDQPQRPQTAPPGLASAISRNLIGKAALRELHYRPPRRSRRHRTTSNPQASTSDWTLLSDCSLLEARKPFLAVAPGLQSSPGTARRSRASGQRRQACWDKRPDVTA